MATGNDQHHPTTRHDTDGHEYTNSHGWRYRILAVRGTTVSMQIVSHPATPNIKANSLAGLKGDYPLQPFTDGKYAEH